MERKFQIANIYKLLQLPKLKFGMIHERGGDDPPLFRFMPYLCAMILTFSQLNDSLNNTIINCPAYYGQCIDGFILLFQTGCRPEEIFTPTLWSDYSATQLRLMPLKGNLPRYLNKADLLTDFVNSITMGAKFLNTITPRQLTFAFNKVYEYSNPRKGDKQSALYLFRYRYFKQLHVDGFTDSQIQSIMGENTLSVAQGYIYANIEVD